MYSFNSILATFQQSFNATNTRCSCPSLSSSWRHHLQICQKLFFYIFAPKKNSKNRRRKVGDIRQNFFSDLNSIQRNFFWFHNWLILNGNSDQQMAPFFTIGPRYLYPIVLQQVWTIQVVCRRCRRQSYVAYVAFKLTLPMQDQQIISFFVSDLGARRK